MEQLGSNNPNEHLTPYIDDAEIVHWVTLPDYYAHHLGNIAIGNLEEIDDGEA